MIPAWKLRREFGRLGQQLRAIPEALSDPLARRRLDRTVAAGLPRLDGALPASDNVALFLVYQPGGLSGSTLATCDWLAAAGYAPLVVSNAALTAADRGALAPRVWRAVERPNFGYDFGGYRDGLSCLRQWGVAPATLLILNDSIWLPVLRGSDLLARLQADPADIAGTVLRRRGAERFLESYLYRIGRRALAHPAFASYWAGLRLTSNKYHVIRRGERGFSAAMRAAGLTLAGLYDSDGLPDAVAAQPEDVLRRTLTHAAYVDAPLAAERDRLLTGGGPEWRAAVLTHMRATLGKRQGYSSFPYAAVALLGYPVLKKSAEPVSREWRRAYLGAVAAGDLPAPPEPILAEAQARQAG
jgi:hypothetical protein